MREDEEKDDTLRHQGDTNFGRSSFHCLPCRTPVLLTGVAHAAILDSSPRRSLDGSSNGIAQTGGACLPPSSERTIPSPAATTRPGGALAARRGQLVTARFLAGNDAATHCGTVLHIRSPARRGPPRHAPTQGWSNKPSPPARAPAGQYNRGRSSGRPAPPRAAMQPSLQRAGWPRTSSGTSPTGPGRAARGGDIGQHNTGPFRKSSRCHAPSNEWRREHGTARHGTRMAMKHARSVRSSP